MIVKINLTGFRSLGRVERGEVLRSYVRVVGGVHSGTVRRILDDVGAALSGEEAEPGIDVADASVKDLGHVANVLKSFGQVAPHEKPPRWTSDFIAALGDVQV